MRYPRIAFAAVLTLAAVPTARSQPQAELVLHFVEIGQGDCTLIECPNGGFILVDAGSTAHGDRDAVRDYVRDQLDQAQPFSPHAPALPIRAESLWQRAPPVVCWQ